MILIDDSPLFLGLLTMFFERRQPGLVKILAAARTGPDGLRAAETVRPAAAIVDLGLPGLPGLEVISELRKRDERVAIVALSGADPEAFQAPVLQAGGDAFVSKDNLHTDLVPALRRAVRARTTPPGSSVPDHE